MAEKTPRAKFAKPIPSGVALYPRLNKPDTKFDAEGVYKVDVRYDPSDPEVATWFEALKKFAIKHDKNPANVGVKHEAGDDGAPTGMLIAKFKTAALWPDGTSRKPAIVDSRKQPLTEIVGGGSILRVNGDMSIYDGFGGGVTLGIKAVQVLKLVPYIAGVDDFNDEGDDDDDRGVNDDFDGSPEPEF